MSPHFPQWKGKLKNMRGQLFWCDDGLVLEVEGEGVAVGAGLVEMEVGDKGTGGEKDLLVVVEDEGNGGGVGDKGRENQCWYDIEDIVEGKGTGGEKDQFGESTNAS